MSVTIKNKYVVLAILGLFLATFAVGWLIGHKRTKSASQTIIDAKNKEIETLLVKVGDQNLYVTKVGQELFTLKEALRQGEIDKAELKALNLKYVSQVTELKGQVRILKDSIAHTGNVIIVTDCDSTENVGKPAIELPFSFKEHNKWYQLDGSMSAVGNLAIDLTVPLAVDVWAGYDKQAKEYKAVVTTENPNVIFNGVRSLKLDLQKPKKYGIGVQVGYGISVEKNPHFAPYVGVGIHRSLIRF